MRLRCSLQYMLDAGREHGAAESIWRASAAMQSPPFLPQKPLEKDLVLHSRFFHPTPERERARVREQVHISSIPLSQSCIDLQERSDLGPATTTLAPLLSTSDSENGSAGQRGPIPS
jgi:hypothetical protein